MRLSLLVFFYCLFSTPIFAESAPYVGLYVCRTNCGCVPSGPYRFTSVRDEAKTKQTLARNECGDDSPVTKIDDSRFLATSWQVTGTLAPDSSRINWSNGSIWERLDPAKTPELDYHLAYWESQAFYCPAGKGWAKFPSKEGDKGAPQCDDGDVVIMNAMLCFAGDVRGCQTVKASQQGDDGSKDAGHWWRSPKKLVEKPKEPSDLEPIKRDPGAKIPFKFNDDQTTFSADHAIGATLYIVQAGDRGAFDRWMAYISRVGPCLTYCGLVPVGSPRYCGNDHCVFRLSGCPMLQVTAEAEHTVVKFCSLAYVPVPDITNLADKLNQAYNEVTKNLPPALIKADLGKAAFDASLKAYREQYDKFATLRAQVDQYLIRLARAPNIVQGIDAEVDSKGYSQHNTLLEIMMLEQLGSGSPASAKKAKEVYDQNSRNPFFNFVVYRNQGHDAQLKEVIAQCPDEKSDRNRGKRDQWMWEREYDPGNRSESMYWDCIFMGELIKDDLQMPLFQNDSVLETTAYKVLEQAQFALNAMSTHLNDMIETIKAIPVPPIVNPLKPPKPQQVIDKVKSDTQKVIGQQQTVIKNVGNTIGNGIKKLSPF
jgi:hypothetical protein